MDVRDFEDAPSEAPKWMLNFMEHFQSRMNDLKSNIDRLSYSIGPKTSVKAKKYGILDSKTDLKLVTPRPLSKASERVKTSNLVSSETNIYPIKCASTAIPTISVTGDYQAGSTFISLYDSENDDLSAMPVSDSGCFPTIKNVIPSNYSAKKSNLTPYKSGVMNYLVSDAFEAVKLHSNSKKCVSKSTLNHIIEQTSEVTVTQNITSLQNYTKPQESNIVHDLSMCMSAVKVVTP